MMHFPECMREGKSTERLIWELNWREPRWVKGNKFKNFARVSQFREQLSSIGDTLDEDELVSMISLNGLTRPWDSFIQTLCVKKESMKFDIVWEDFIQEEARVANRESLLREDDQALAIHAKGRKQ